MYENIIDKFMPSVEMRAYLKTVPLSHQAITEMVAFSPAPLDDKMEGLCKLKEYADINYDLELSKEAESYIRSGQKALSLLSEEGVFSVEVSFFDDDKLGKEGYFDGIFGSFDEVINFCKEDMILGEHDPHEPLWYTVDKWRKSSNGKYDSVCTYIVVWDKIWFYRLNTNAIKDDFDYKNMYDGRNLNLPVPFKTGNLLETDGFPFGPKSKSLILDIGDNSDCCCVQALSKNEDGLWKTGALKHGYVSFETYPMVSPLYTATIYNGELKEDEKILTKVKGFIETGKDEADAFMNEIFLSDLEDEEILCFIKKFVIKKEMDRRYNSVKAGIERVKPYNELLPSPDLLSSKVDKKYRKRVGLEKSIARLIKKERRLCDKKSKCSSRLSLKDIIETDGFKLSKSKVTIAIGKNDLGERVTADLAELRHILVGGRCSKEVLEFINSAIISILFKATPGDVKMAIIDTNSAGLDVYNGLPHLLTKVETDPGKAIILLELINDIMRKRLSLFVEKGVKDIKQYNEKIALNNKSDDADYDNSPDILTEIVIIATELSDLMQNNRNAVETTISNLGQLGKKAGIYLILGTQNPSLEVVTGEIKANILSRIAFDTDSSFDSRALLDIAGAEEIIGEGKMLYYPNGQMDVTRIQAPEVTRKEIENVADFWKVAASAEEAICKHVDSDLKNNVHDEINKRTLALIEAKWNDIVQSIKEENTLSEISFTTWVKAVCPAEYDNGILKLDLADQSMKYSMVYIMKHFGNMFKEAIKKKLGLEIQVAI